MISRHLVAACFLAVFFSSPSKAVIRGEAASDDVRPSVVRVESSKGELCSGVLIAPDVVLTAAHCVAEQARYKVTGTSGSRIRSVKALAASMHPEFVPGTTPRTQPGIDLALLLMEQPLGSEFTPLDVSRSAAISEGEKLIVAGFGLSRENAKSTARTLRQASLLAVGMLQVANRVQIVVDPVTLGETSGAGACRGDSGGPILRGASPAHTLVGIVSWSSGPLNARARNACGGLTAVTPVAPHTSWIQRRSQSLRDANQNADTPAALLGGTYDWTVR
jgi:hypothetical protein